MIFRVKAWRIGAHRYVKAVLRNLGAKFLQWGGGQDLLHAPASPSKDKLLVSPLAPKGGFPQLPSIEGVTFSSISAGIKYQDRDDIMLASLTPGTTIAGVFTRSSTRSACVRDCQKKLSLKTSTKSGAAIIVNSGNSNTFTGQRGEKTVEDITSAVSSTLSIPINRVFSASTGVIGEPLEAQKIIRVLPSLASRLKRETIDKAAHAIITTDTFAKGASAMIEGDGGPIYIAGIAKGSGMIAPDMATMLVYLFTDARISAGTLQKMLSRNVDTTFNSITIDSDTSTSDMLLLAATGQSTATTVKGAVAKAFETALHQVMQDLALQIVRDGEGASKLVELRISGAASQNDAANIAFSIANSPLVKTAIAGEDPNWGRIIAAIGKSGAMADRDKLKIYFGDLLVAKNGWRNPKYREEDGATYFKKQELLIHVDLGLGKGKRNVWTCDLTQRYVEINADYRS